MTDQNSVERELKFSGVDHETLRERLEELGAERLYPSVLERNWVLDRDGEIEGAGSLLRVRKDGRGATVTFKGPATYEGRTKLRRELEIEVDDLDGARALFEALGYQTVKEYQKMREGWQLGGVDIALDHTPIGDFAEFEGEQAEALAKRFGFDPAKAERRTYLRLYDDHLADHPDAPRDMVFKSQRTGSE